MKTQTKWVIASVVVVILLGWLFLGNKGKDFVGAVNCMGAGTTCFTNIGATGTLTVDGTTTFGSSGTAITKIIAPTNCTVIANANTISASSTKDVDCVISGITASDTFVAVATTSLSTTFGGVEIIASRASTTSGYATITLYNGTGGTFTWTGTASTSLKGFAIQ